MNETQRLQEDIESYLLSHESNPANADECPIQYAAIARVRPRDAGEAAGIQTKLQQVLSGLQGRGGKKGVSIIIGMPEIARVEPNIRALTGLMTLVIEVHENIMVNTTTQSCEDFAYAVAEVLNHQPFGHWSPVRVKSILPAPEAVLMQKVVYNVTLETDMRRQLKPKVGSVKMEVPENGYLVMTCPTIDAVIYYTLDGSYPGPSSASAIVYDVQAGLTLPVGVHRVRAAGWLAGLAGSVAAETLVTVE